MLLTIASTILTQVIQHLMVVHNLMFECFAYQLNLDPLVYYRFENVHRGGFALLQRVSVMNLRHICYSFRM